MQYRSRQEIIKSILEALPDIKTRIMYKAELQYYHTNQYLNDMLSTGLIDVEFTLQHGYPSRPVTYLITERGIKYLDAVNALSSLVTK